MYYENRRRAIVELGNIQFGFRKGMSTTEPIFALRILQKIQERKKEGKKERIYIIVFIDLEQPMIVSHVT